MGDISHRDSNRELVMELAQIHYKQCDPDGLLKRVSLQDPDYVCKECARLIGSGSIEQAVELVRERRANAGGNKGVVNLPSHLVALDGYRQEAEAWKTVFEDAGDAVDQTRQLRTENDDLKAALSKALVDLAALKEQLPQLPEQITVADLKGILRETPDEVINAMPYIGEGNISAVRAWAETADPSDG